MVKKKVEQKRSRADGTDKTGINQRVRILTLFIPIIVAYWWIVRWSMRINDCFIATNDSLIYNLLLNYL